MSGRVAGSSASHGIRPVVPRLHLVTNRRLCETREQLRVVADAAAGDLGAVQLREKDLPAGELCDVARALRRVIGQTLLLINDRVDVALAVGAAGVHLPEGGLSIAVARDLLGPAALIGRSVHDVEAAKRAAAEGADYLILGTIFATASKPGRAGAGLALIEAVTCAVTTPVIAIGGIDERNLAGVIGAGAYGVAVMSAILRSPAPAATVERLQAIIRREAAWR